MMEIKDLKAGDEVYVNYWSCFYSFWLKKMRFLGE